ncbi:CD276 antigen homolog [Heptranchias perlo]|uniref:CD276 antigen homolog n=1 Tax=Heptranchias perlo TaxID=212740 RepID=UPI00355975E6
MFLPALLQCIVILGIISTVVCDAVFKLSQSPQRKTVLVGANITFACAFTPFQDNSEVNAYWWRLDETVFLQTNSDRRKLFFIRKGQGSFQLLDIRLQDAGVYYCGVKHERHAIRNGTGSTLVVHAPPAPPTIVSQAPDRNSNMYLVLVCETFGFYPEIITLSWYKNKSNIVTAIQTTKQLNSAGLYEASSILQDSEPLQRGTYYTCLVSHTTLQTPNIAVYLVSDSNPGIGVKSQYLLTAGCVFSGLVCLVLGIIIGRRCPSRNRTCTESNQDGSHSEEPTMQQIDDKKLTYAALNIAGSERRGMQKQKGKSTEYAAIRLQRQERETRPVHNDPVVK